MSEPAKIKRVIQCLKCDVAVVATREGFYRYDEWVPRWGHSMPVGFSLWRCPRCNQPIVTAHVFEDPDDDQMKIRYPVPGRLLPEEVPETVSETFHEGLLCLKATAYSAAVMMCRKCLEATCAHFQVGGRDLKTKLDQLAAQEIIDPMLAEWSHHLRLAGNSAAHDVDRRLSKEDADDIVTFTRALLEYVFSLRVKFQQFTERRAQP